MKKILKNSVISTLGFLFVMAFSPLVNAAENPFGMSNVTTNTQVASNHMEGKCGDSMKGNMDDKGKCGDSKKKAKKDGKCGEGKCGDSMKKAKKDDKDDDSMKKSMDGGGKCGNM